MSETDLQVQLENAPIVKQISHTLSIEEIQDWLACRIAEQLGLEPEEIDLQLPFSRYGLSSFQAMSIATQGKQEFGVAFSPLVMWSFPNIKTLSEFLARESATTDVEVFEL